MSTTVLEAPARMTEHEDGLAAQAREDAARLVRRRAAEHQLGLGHLRSLLQNSEERQQQRRRRLAQDRFMDPGLKQRLLETASLNTTATAAAMGISPQRLAHMRLKTAFRGRPYDSRPHPDRFNVADTVEGVTLGVIDFGTYAGLVLQFAIWSGRAGWDPFEQVPVTIPNDRHGRPKKKRLRKGLLAAGASRSAVRRSS